MCGDEQNLNFGPVTLNLLRGLHPALWQALAACRRVARSHSQGWLTGDARGDEETL